MNSIIDQINSLQTSTFENQCCLLTLNRNISSQPQLNNYHSQPKYPIKPKGILLTKRSLSNFKQIQQIHNYQS